MHRQQRFYVCHIIHKTQGLLQFSDIEMDCSVNPVLMLLSFVFRQVSETKRIEDDLQISKRQLENFDRKTVKKRKTVIFLKP